MKNLKKLSRNELRNLSGGRAQSCSVVVKNPNGTYSTHYGSCYTPPAPVGSSLSEIIVHELTASSYCSTDLGQVALSSNGGVSHCND